MSGYYINWYAERMDPKVTRHIISAECSRVCKGDPVASFAPHLATHLTWSGFRPEDHDDEAFVNRLQDNTELNSLARIKDPRQFDPVEMIHRKECLKQALIAKFGSAAEAARQLRAIREESNRRSFRAFFDGLIRYFSPDGVVTEPWATPMDGEPTVDQGLQLTTSRSVRFRPHRPNVRPHMLNRDYRPRPVDRSVNARKKDPRRYLVPVT